MAGTNFSPAKFFNNVMRTPVQQHVNQDVDNWYTPVTSPRPSHRDSDDGMSVQDLVASLKEHNHDLHAHHLTSVIAGLNTTQIFSLKPEDFKPAIPSVIAPVTMADFKDFLSTTKGRTERFFGRKKKQNDLPRGRTGSSSGLTDSTGRSIFDFREPLEQWQEESQLSPQETLEQCYANVPETFFNSTFDPITDAPDVLILVDRTTLLRAQMENEHSYDADNLEAEIINWKDELGGHLSEHLDLVEKCLFTQTTTRADTIFSTVTNLHSLQSMVALESGRVAGLRKHVADLRAVTTTGRAQVLSLQRKRSNAAALHKTLEAIKAVSLARPAMDRLLSANDYTGAFAVLEQALHILDGELNGVVALRTLARQFREMKEVIGGEMADTFVRVAMDRLDTTQTGSAASQAVQASQTNEEMMRFRANLGPLVRGMLRKGNLRDALAKHRVRLLELIKNTAKLVLQQALETVPQDRRGEALKEMNLLNFVSFLRATFEGLEIILARAELVHNAVVASLPSPSTGVPSSQTRSARKQSTYAVAAQPTSQVQQQQQQSVVASAANNNLQLSAEEIRELTSASAAVVLKVRESAQNVVVRLLTFRDDAHSMLSLQEFKVIYDAIQDFIAASGEPATELKQAIGKQCQLILNSLDERQLAGLRAALDEELWEMQPAVPRDVQSIVTRLESGKVLVNDMQVEDGFRAGQVFRENDTETQARRHLVVGNRSLKVTNVALTMIRYIQDYARCAVMFPTVAYQAATKAFDCLFFYDERIRRLILGAEVKQKGRLATIGSKHLAMASQSLTIVHLLLHPLCKVFVDHVPPQQQTKVEDDLMRRVEKTIRDHLILIGETLVSLIVNEINRLGVNIQKMDWDGAGVTGLKEASEYMVDFCTKVSKLHTVLNNHLDKISLEEVFQGVKPQNGSPGFEGVFHKINTRVPEFFQNINPKTPAGQMRVRVDINELVLSLRRLRGQAGPGFGPGTTLEDWVNAKYGRVGGGS